MSKISVLVVEDDRWLAEQYSRVLEKAGFRAIVASHVLSAIDAIDDTHPDVIILDILLAGSTAMSLLHELQSYEDTGNIPIILCTNLAADIVMEDVEPYGVKRILDKATMAPEDLVVAVKSIIE